MDWLQSLDVAVFRFVNLSLSNPVFDRLMPWLSKGTFMFPVLLIVAGVLIWRFRARGTVCVILLLLAVLLGDTLVVNQMKIAVNRPRPFNVVTDAHLLVGKGNNSGMPSGHAANWFAAAMVTFLYFRRLGWVMFPVAAAVAFSRIYNGVHYPSDVLVGSLLGCTYAFLGVWMADVLWRKVGERWFPLWWRKLPSLRHPEQGNTGNVALSHSQEKLTHLQSQQWLRLGYVVIGLLLLLRLFYISSGTIELSEDEAYQWVWSKHPALSYFSKPPMIAYTQWLGTHLWGDNEFGVRFFSPVIAALLSFLSLRFMAREVSAQAGFWLVLILTAAPMTSAGAVLMTIDPLNVLFWVAAMLAGWRAVQENSTRLWLWTGLWMGLGFLSKYTTLFQLLSWAVFFVLWKPARAQLRRPGPYLALLILALCTLPVIIWNQQHGWITVTHLEHRGGLTHEWVLKWQFIYDYFIQEMVLLHPVFCVAMVWACVAFWKRHRKEVLPLYLFCMGAPLVVFYTLLTVRAKVQPNWIVPAVVPLFCLMVIYWHRRWQEGARWVKYWLIGGVSVGLVGVVFFHETTWVAKITGRPLPDRLDPLRRIRAWEETAKVVNEVREKLAMEGKPVFIIGDHYGITGEVSFYLPEAKRAVTGLPVVYYQSSAQPDNQFYYWPGYAGRKGENAIYIQQGHKSKPTPERLTQEFRTVTDLGFFDVKYRGRVYRTIQLFECRDLL